MAKHVAVLMGGWSSEREVSLVTGKACAKALREANHAIVSLSNTAQTRSANMSRETHRVEAPRQARRQIRCATASQEVLRTNAVREAHRAIDPLEEYREN